MRTASLEKSFRSLNTAGVQEKRDIRSEIAEKVTSSYASVTNGKHNEKEYKALKPKGLSRIHRDLTLIAPLVRVERNLV